MRDASNHVREFLQETGLEPTLNRMLVFSAIDGSDHPLSARDVHEQVARNHSLNRVTVYRILDLFAEKGVVNRITVGERVFRYCARRGRDGSGHSHFHCTRCGRVSCIDNRELHFDEAALHLPCNVNSVALRLEGICPLCARCGED